jgi:ParB family chromosome partitioning protein
MTEVTTIALNKLIPWTGNVRKTAGADTALAELAASIAAHGLLQPLVVRAEKRGKFAVVAGCRRLEALRRLAAKGALAQDAGIACSLMAAEANATEASLAENAVREQMHPADEFEAFRALIDDGASIADVAARFGYSESTVEKRLKLARVSPLIIKAYRDGEIGLDHVMAFAATDDQAAQERIWTEAPPWMKEEAAAIREALTEHDIAASDRRVKFVTLKAYEKAGGGVRRDLFSEGEEGVFILDVLKLDQLAAAKLEKAAAKIRKEGWKWVDVYADFGYDESGRFERVFAESLPLTIEEQAELRALEIEADASYDIEGDLSPEQQARFDEVTARMEELTDERETFWLPESFAIAGAVVSIDRDGKAEVTRGLVRPEDAPVKAKAKNGSAVKDKEGLPAALTQSLTEEKSAAISAALLERPDVALAVIAHAFAGEVFYGGARTSLDLLLSPRSFKSVAGTKASEAILYARAAWSDRLPEDPADLFDWCLEQRPETLLDLLAFCAAMAIDCVQAKGKPEAGRAAHADALAHAIGFDIAAWFAPTAANYFSRISKPQILSALQEAKGVPPAPSWSAMKKAELAALAEREAAGKGWLPAPLRLNGAVGAQAA